MVWAQQLRNLLPRMLLGQDMTKKRVLRLRIRMFLGLLDLDPDPLVRGTDPDPDPSIIKQK